MLISFITRGDEVNFRYRRVFRRDGGCAELRVLVQGAVPPFPHRFRNLERVPFNDNINIKAFPFQQQVSDRTADEVGAFSPYFADFS